MCIFILEYPSRVTFAVPIAIGMDGNGVVNETEILQTNHYYPFGMVMEGNQVNQQGITNHYQYNGKELNTDFGLDWLDYAARWYDASIARWSAVDPLAEKYYLISSYAYVANNPLKYIASDGMRFEDGDNIVKDYREGINSRIEGLDAILNDKDFDYEKYKTTKEAVQAIKDELNGIIGELDEMKKSDQLYKVSFDDEMTKGEGGVSFDNSDNSVVIGVGKGSGIGVISQELLHGYQFETGKLSISYDNSEYGSLYDITDETATYNREQLVGNLLARKTVDDAWTLKHGASMNPPAYQDIPTSEKSLSSPEGMRLQMYETWRRKSAPLRPLPTEVFIGWDKEKEKKE